MLKCPDCGSDENYSTYQRWGTVNYFDYECDCGCEWSTESEKRNERRPQRTPEAQVFFG